ncbi:MAG TPA: SIS domain-containing protein [Candidatus Limnocylindrales bacterium]|nr:SIS domain-containing protein [Candidatus Limnocylindrales bacterium]
MPDQDSLRREWDEHLDVARATAALLPAAAELADRICAAFERGGKVIAFGNGGSAAEAQHFAGELLGRFRDTRRSLPAIALSTDPSVVTCIANDFSYDDLFSRQVEGLVTDADVVIGITTSGRSENVVRGLRAARDRNATSVAWTGADPGPAGEAAHLVLAVPSSTTARVQEMHTLLMHTICVAIDAWVARAGSADDGAGA